MKKIEGKTLWKMLVVVLLIANSFYWCVKKEGYYIDELWSYGLSNSYYAPFLHQEDGYMHNWHQSMFYEDYLMVRQGERFSYDSVYYNQMQDVHPPFYYMILHTICSMFPNRFSKWFGLGINLLFFGGSTFLLYKISEMILGKGSSGSLIPPLLYGLSRGAVSNLIYIRMYMMLTFWALLLVFLTLVLIRTNESSKSRKLLAGIGVTMTAGFLTQYYFIVFASLFGGYTVWRLLVRQWRKAVEYCTAVCLGVVSGVLIFPTSLYHIFHGLQGQGSAEHAGTGLIFLEGYWNVVLEDLWGSSQIEQLVLFGAFFVLSITVICKWKSQKKQWGLWNSEPKKDCLMLFGAVSGYFILITLVESGIASRYQYIIYPFCVLLAVAFAAYLFKQLKIEKLLPCVAAACGLLFIIRLYSVQPLPYVYKGYQEALDRLDQDYKNDPGIYVTSGNQLVINNSLLLARHDRTYSLTSDQLSEIPALCEAVGAERIVLYIDVLFDEAQIIQQVMQLLDYQSSFLLYDNEYTQLYVISF